MQQTFEPDRNRWLHHAVVAKGKHRDLGDDVTNTLSTEDIETLLATMESRNLHPDLIAQAQYDLTEPAFQLFDWIGMGLDGRYKGYGETPQQRKRAYHFFRSLATLYLVTPSLKQCKKALHRLGIE